MKYSRADVTASFGAAYILPRRSCDVRINASEALRDVLNNMGLGDTVTYLALASTSNLAAALSYLGFRDPERRQRLRQVATVHIFEKGYSLAVDDAATAQILGEAGLRCVVYLPRFYDPAVTFSFSTWGQFSAVAQGAGASKAVAWLFSAWSAKKVLVEAHDDDPLTAFFRERGPASSLVTLCALDATVQASCIKYRTAVAQMSFQFDLPASTGDGRVSYSISGNNVTWPSSLLVKVGDSRNATQFLVAQPADSLPPATTAPLVGVFWSVWLDLLRL
ncbi:cell wall surface anchor family protein [Trypanosoma grayi]|uniref:cell wall surface anchor family protein n=1 Tax=Trypanosoma grayi TaxID=71804 RepID=UPI0004F4A384|nr:cell wall surface anchor family protein [Trypanosoma grayi]KEG11922.1 cell wall surface anchor family protein [Trypanosoma grayi]